MFLRHDKFDDNIDFCTMSRSGGGGACAAKTKTALVIGVWHKDQKSSLGKNQNAGECELQVCKIAKQLFDANM